MASHHGVAALLIASLLVAVTLADASPTLTVHHDTLGVAINRGTAAVVIMCLLLVAVTLADALPPASPLVCDKVYGVQKHETCFAVAQAEGLSLKKFLRFNPNINCNNLFIGQWICLHAHRA
ncbi:hypothetical protein HU200_012921 [Digitaria exilis]|uniref:LysM domain-containing protein n=1 Tax=Digitaria exilis TaxID=1010633 RepID=A0A835FDX2_9POAL|nr:hypothetical protein HU200_012921 [Digitaria exilis]